MPSSVPIASRQPFRLEDRITAVAMRSLVRLLPERLLPAGTFQDRGPLRQRRLQAEFEEARRTGRWHTEEDRILLREHEARLAAEKRTELLRTAGQRSTLGLLVVSWFVPVLWPVAIAGSFLLFPRTSRRLLFGVLGLGVATALALTLLVGQWLRGGDPPALAPLPSAPLTEPSEAESGRAIAERLEREADHWQFVSSDGDGPAMLRKGVYREWGGRSVMVIPRPSWLALTPGERRSLAAHVRRERGVVAIHAGRVVPSPRFEGNTILVEERVWP
jgi:hypothetical protein